MRLIQFIRVNILRKFIDLRILSQKELPYDEIIRLELLVAMCLIALTFGASYLLAGVFFNIGLMGVLNYLIFFLTTIPLVLYLTRKGMHNPAKLIMMVLGSIFMFIKAASLGRDSGMNISMMIIIFATFAFYNLEDYKYILLSLTISITSIIVLEVTDYSLFGIDPSTNKYEYEFNYSTTILFCVLFFYVILRVNQYINKKLIRSNFKLIDNNKRLAKINEEMDNYVYKASHDMRAPITSIMGILALIKTEKDPDTIRHLIELQEKSILKLDNHIHQIIDLSRNIKTDVTPEPIDLKKMVEEVFEELNFFENSGTVKKIIQINQQVPFHNDLYRVKMILNNIISNCYKYARKSEANSYIEVTATVTPASATILVTDNGIGIETEYQPRIFDMFYRGTPSSKGAGLGLYMVKEMITKLNGTIAVSSETNKYTQFTFSIPNIHNKEVVVN